ncbi:hypothetical protein [Blastococcus sp. SYSU DS0617]
MRERLLHAPAWVLGLVNGSLFGLVWAAFMRFGGGESWPTTLTYGGVAGAVFGGLRGRIQYRQQQGLRDVAARSPEGLSRRVRRAASRGPVPADPEVREAAHGLVLAQLAPLDRQRLWATPFFVLVALLSAFLAVTDSPWWWLAVVAWTVAAAGHPWKRARLRRRAELLRGDGSEQPAGRP